MKAKSNCKRVIIKIKRENGSAHLTFFNYEKTEDQGMIDTKYEFISFNFKNNDEATVKQEDEAKPENALHGISVSLMYSYSISNILTFIAYR